MRSRRLTSNRLRQLGALQIAAVVPVLFAGAFRLGMGDTTTPVLTFVAAVMLVIGAAVCFGMARNAAA